MDPYHQESNSFGEPNLA